MLRFFFDTFKIALFHLIYLEFHSINFRMNITVDVISGGKLFWDYILAEGASEGRLLRVLIFLIESVDYLCLNRWFLITFL